MECQDSLAVGKEVACKDYRTEKVEQRSDAGVLSTSCGGAVVSKHHEASATAEGPVGSDRDLPTDAVEHDINPIACEFADPPRKTPAQLKTKDPSPILSTVPMNS